MEIEWQTEVNMQYREFKDLQLSQLGFGAMRLPVIDGDDAKVDVPQTMRMVEYAMEHGVNYYDTAWGYHGEHSEEIMGEALRRYPRDSYYLADKFPGYDLANMPKVKEIFENLFRAFCLEVNGDIDGIAEDGNQTWAIVDGKLLPTDPKLQKTYIKKGLTFYSEEQ